MKKLMFSVTGALLVGLVMAAVVFAGGPQGQGAGRGPAADQGTTVGDILGLTQSQVQDLRQDGQSLAQIAEQQKVDPQKLVDALAARWTVRIEARVEAGALTPAEATELRTQVELRARDMVYRTTIGGMQGIAVGAGNGQRESGAGTPRVDCDGTGNGPADGTMPRDGSGFRGGAGGGNGNGYGGGRGGS